MALGTIRVAELDSLFAKIVKVDWANNTCEIYKAHPDETVVQDVEKDFNSWVKWFVENKHIFPDDAEKFISFIQKENVTEHFKNNSGPMSIEYRRRISEDTYRWCNMTITKCVETDDDINKVTIFVRDIHDAYIAKEEKIRALESRELHDTATGLMSVNSYEAKRVKLKLSGIYSVGVMSLKLTGKNRPISRSCYCTLAEILKFSFRTNEIYHIDGPVFKVITEGMGNLTFVNAVDTVKANIDKIMGEGACLVGWSYECDKSFVKTNDLDQLIRKAEDAMIS